LPQPLDVVCAAASDAKGSYAAPSIAMQYFISRGLNHAAGGAAQRCGAPAQGVQGGMGVPAPKEHSQ